MYVDKMYVEYDSVLEKDRIIKLLMNDLDSFYISKISMNVIKFRMNIQC